MSLEVLNTLGTLITVVIVAAAAIAALVQLRHLRAGNQINAMLAIGEELGAKSMRDAMDVLRNKLSAAMHDPKFRDFAVSAARSESTAGSDPEGESIGGAARVVGNAWEELGILVKRGIVERDIFLDRYCWVIMQNWRLMEPFIALVRDAASNSAIWENFEYLAVLAQDFLRQRPSTYPVGVRRMNVVNPWPIAAQPARS